MHILAVNDYAVGLCVVKNILDVICFKPVVDPNLNSPSGSNAKDGL
jgi:hypothetical protein